MPIVIGMVCMSFVAYNRLIIIFEYFGKRMNEILRYPQKARLFGNLIFYLCVCMEKQNRSRA